MSFFKTIHEALGQRNLRFLVIGGLAINYYGYPRETSDLDFLVSQADRMEWLKLLAEFQYTIHHDGGNFVQYNPPAQNAWPVDLMLVQEDTFISMLACGRNAELFGVKTTVPSLNHLIALKLHVLKHTRTHRFLKDFLDVENLIRINRLDVRSDEIRKLFIRYGTQDLYEKISRSLASD